MKLKQLLYGTVVSTAFVIATSAAQAAFPAYGSDTGPGILITIGNSSTIISATGQGPYDGSDDTYVGVINNSSKGISSLNLNSSSEDIFGFDGDGIDTFGAPSNTTDTTGYGGPNAYFTNISPDAMRGTVNFINPVAGNGGTDYFSLEESLDATSLSSGTPEPAIWAMLLVGFAGLGIAVRRTKVPRAATA